MKENVFYNVMVCVCIVILLGFVYYFFTESPERNLDTYIKGVICIGMSAIIYILAEIYKKIK